MMPSMTSTTEQTIARIHIFFRDFCCDKENRDMVGCWQGLHWQTALSETAADSPDSRRLSGAALFLALRELQHSQHWPRCYLRGRIYSKVRWEPMKLEETSQLNFLFYLRRFVSFLVQPSQLLLPLNTDLDVDYNGKDRRLKAFRPALE